MVINLGMNWENFYKDNIMSYIKSLQANPFELVTLILDLAIVMFLVYCFFMHVCSVKREVKKGCGTGKMA